MTALPNLSHSSEIRKSGVLVLSGWGIRVHVQAGHLCTEDGIADERRKFRLPKVCHGLRRLVCIGSEFFITGEALLWLAAQDAAFVNLDRRGKVIVVCGPVSSSDAKLRRAQALALGNGTALKISKQLISKKLTGQELLAREMLHDSATADAIVRFMEQLLSAESMDAVRLIEAQAARLYWQAWSDIPIWWPRRDEHRTPEHWKRFGSRISPLTHSPRLASNPPNALLNFLYGILEGEARLSAVAMGLDPAIGFLHVDTPNRDSLACDLMEVCRPCGVDAFVLNWLLSEPLCRSDFWEDRNGNCRIASPLAIKLCETSDTWRKLMSPVAEYVAQETWSSISGRGSSVAGYGIATRLTQRNKREVKGSDVPIIKAPKPETVCRGCGKSLHKGKRHCPSCAVEASRENMAQVALIGHAKPKTRRTKVRISKALSDHAVANSWWSPSSLPAWLNEECYVQKIQPQLRAIKVREIAQALKVSKPYAAFIRAGRRRPHPRHWLALAKMANVSLSEP